MEEAVMKNRPYWFVGAMHGDIDKFQQFIDESVWVNGYDQKYIQDVKSMQVGDRIAIKAAYTRLHDLPFDNRGNRVSVMAIKAIGTIAENLNDGKNVKVAWEPVSTPREWYFYTYQKALWKITPQHWRSKALVDFTFSDQPQDIRLFRNAPYWKERFGDQEKGFEWTVFYEELANKLLQYRHDRTPLINAIQSIGDSVSVMKVLRDKQADGTLEDLSDICPFTVFALFNRHITDKNRSLIAQELADFLSLENSVPQTFTGIPVVNNQNTWFFSYARDRNSDDIDKLWQMLEAAINLSDSTAENEVEERAFYRAYDEVSKVRGVGWNITFGLYWVRPWYFLPLDQQSRHYIKQYLTLEIAEDGIARRCRAVSYLRLVEQLTSLFADEEYPVHSFPELSYEAYLYISAENGHEHQFAEGGEDAEDTTPGGLEAALSVQSFEPYTVGDIVNDGCFIQLDKLNVILERLHTKKNLILQGPPGTGKTWLAKRLAYALMEEKAENRLRAVQFHPNLSYEDFVRGWRPNSEGGLVLTDGLLLDMVQEAKRNTEKNYVLVIEEINRGNPAQIFGEILTLLEADKRTPGEALSLCYRREGESRVYVPPNLYIVGTMNIADRSLALVDFALRRRFAFIDLKPELDQPWLEWVSGQFDINVKALGQIQQRMKQLNSELSADSNLGEQFQIGHSYVTPARGQQVVNVKHWFEQVVETEITPLLKEYWFDAPQKVQSARSQLLAEW